MQKINILHKNYTINQKIYQLKLPINIEYMIPSNDSVRLLSQFVEEMDLSDLYKTYSKVKENQASPRKLLKIILYGYMNRLYSSRDIEKACYRDINFMYLLEGSKAPDHSTFARFRSLHFAPCATRILSEVSNFLYKIGEISGEAIFIDGTKIEASSNKYTFVWKKAVTKNMKRLLIKIADLVSECNELYGIKVGYRNNIKLKDIKKLRKRLYKIKKSENIEFVHGCGKLTIGPQPTDTTTLIPFLKSMEENLNFKYLKIVADSGYESEENYSFIETNNQILFIKPSNYEISKTRKYQNDISRIENMKYNYDGDYYICKNNKKLYSVNLLTRKSKTGFKSRKTIYKCEDCSNCKYKTSCIKGHNCRTPLEQRTKKLETSKRFNRQRKEDLERIISAEGCELRMNRSIQAEGSFAELKQDMGFRRFLCRGTENVLASKNSLRFSKKK